MNIWKSVFQDLAEIEDIFIRWHLQPGGYVYMYAPKRNDIGDYGLSGESAVLYEDIIKIEIPRLVTHGSIKISNKIEEIMPHLRGTHGIKIEVDDGGISIESLLQEGSMGSI